MSADFFNLVIRLKHENVRFVLIGGFAARAYGCTILTEDLDLCCDFAPDNLMRLQKALSGLHPVHRMTPGRKPLDLNEKNCLDLKNLYLDTDLGQLDCLSFVQGVGDFQKVKKQSTAVSMETIEIDILQLDAILQSKKSLNREHDREAIRQLEAIQKIQSKLPAAKQAPDRRPPTHE